MLWPERFPTAVLLGLAICLVASHASGQQQPAQTEQPRRTDASASSSPQPAPGPAVGAYPLELLGLLAPPAQRGPITLTPSISISEEYNDNIFSDNRNRESDFITNFSPALSLVINKPSYQLTAGYSFTADLYAKNSDLSQAFDRQSLVASGLYRVSPSLTLTVSDSFAYDRSTNVVAGPSTGRQESWSNAFSPGLLWQLSPRNSLSLSASYSVLRFLGGSDSGGGGVGGGGGEDSDTYGFQSTFSHAFTPRLSGSLGYKLTYIDLEEDQEDSTTHTPTIGLGYRFTPTLTGAISAGPSITTIGGDTFIGPTGNVSLTQVFQFGSLGVAYARDVSVAGGFGGTNETQTASATLAVTTLWPGLVVVLNPVYSEATTLGNRQTEKVDVKTFTVSLGASYVIARYTTIFAGYTFLHQRTGGSSSSTEQLDVDQNRIRIGLQFGYPFNFD